MNIGQSIGVFDSGYGGLTVFKSIAKQLPQYNYIYLGDNARAPYGDHSFETVYQYTLECVEWLFAQGCPLVILACNTASAKALRSIQQKVLPFKYPNHRVLGVIRPTAEVVGQYTQHRKIGVMGTRGTVNSLSYPMEINKFYPDIEVAQQACPMWVPLIENNEHIHRGADYFVQKYLDQLLEKDAAIDCILLACTHYPLLIPKLQAILPAGIELLGQADIVANSLELYLQNHPEIAEQISQQGSRRFFTSGDRGTFDQHASIFFGEEVESDQMHLKI
ncbi:glutamate racemase [Pedobacter sp. PACM 27299]|uniref:glutamate racemase n=1 Tax=Pedobacter sp. PACM 27299 TaxID=1727164 RepID=UPI0007059008|nr:glutamate racemase [Pedobacter sp. PACM 27299]ALL08003.1 glutamate racemase [Pedobacter sp. PACM 27299]